MDILPFHIYCMTAEGEAIQRNTDGGEVFTSDLSIRT